MFPTEFKPSSSKAAYNQASGVSEQDNNRFPVQSVAFTHSSHILLALQIFLIILFARCSRIELTNGDSIGTVTQGYFYFGGIEIMMFIGFGYLMTFIKTYGLGAVGFTMLITAIGLQWYLFTESFFSQIFNNYINGQNLEWHAVQINIYSLMDALFGVSAVLISFGAIIGKAKPTQLIVMTILELIFHAFNYEVILVGGLKVADIGGTYADHMFGAYFGLTVTMCLFSSASTASQRVSPVTGYAYDIFALIGTLFLWVYWPSFVAGPAVADSPAQQRAVINTILSLSASTISSFYLSSLLNPFANKHRNHFQFRPVDIQNATLAGGVAVGCIANLSLNPVNAIFVGCAAGSVSTFGYHVLQPYLQQKFNLHDTCGVHNLHGMPSVIGAIASVILAGYKQGGGHDGDIYPPNGAWWRQLVGIFLTILCAVITGAFTAAVMHWVDPVSLGDHPFDDSAYWEVGTGYVYKINDVEGGGHGGGGDIDNSVHSVVGAAYVRGGAIRGGGSTAGGSVHGNSTHGNSTHGKESNLVAINELMDD